MDNNMREPSQVRINTTHQLIHPSIQEAADNERMDVSCTHTKVKTAAACAAWRAGGLGSVYINRQPLAHSLSNTALVCPASFSYLLNGAQRLK